MTDTAPKKTQARDVARVPEKGDGVHLTELAAKYVRQYMDKTDSPETQYVFFGVKGGGCSGLSYVLDLRDERSAPIADTDEVFLSHDVVVVCDLKSYMVGNLAGTTVDYQEGMMNSGFTFDNPNAKHSCGCGSSYSA
jgi:iron-sulfur cluster assembly protein